MNGTKSYFEAGEIIEKDSGEDHTFTMWSLIVWVIRNPYIVFSEIVENNFNENHLFTM